MDARSVIPFLVRRAQPPSEDSPAGEYDEQREITLLAGLALVLGITGRSRTSTLTNVIREAADPDPTNYPGEASEFDEVRIRASSVLRTQTFTKAGGEPPDADRPDDDDLISRANGSAEKPGPRDRYIEGIDITLGPDGVPVVKRAGRLLRTQTSTRIRGEAADPD